MPNSYRVRTSLGEDKVIPIKLDQEFDTLEILSLSIFPNDVYTRNCAEFGVICGRVFANKGLGIQNARVSVFIPIQPEDEGNPIISTLYPYKSFTDFNEDGYKYNLLPYVQSYTGHVPVGTFPDRIDALTNPAVVEVYDKYYKFTAKTNDAGDFMIFGVPVGEHDIFMQVDLSDIGEFSLTPQDLIRMGRATEGQVNGTSFKFSENYSELPQIVTLTKTVQVAPFYGEKDICDYYIVRADFDLTSEAAIEFKPTAVFMGSLISSNNRKKLKKNCKVPGKQGWLCDLVTGPGQIECIRQTIFTDEDGRPVLEEHKLENDGKLIDSNGTWLVELPMNLDYIYTDENGNRRISPDGSVGVPIRGKYRFKIKWQQTTALNEEDRRAYFLVPNVKEHGWTQSLSDADDPALSTALADFIPTLDANSNITSLGPSTNYYSFESSSNVSSYTVLVDGVERPEYQQLIPMPELVGSTVQISYSLIDAGSGNGSIRFNRLNSAQFQLQSSYSFSLNWADYGTDTMIQEAISCEDRFYEFQYNKVYTVSQLIDRYTGGIFPSKTIQIKHITDNKCEGDYYPFPTNDTQYRYDIFFIVFGFVVSIFKFIFIPLTIMLHVLALLWIPIAAIIFVIQTLINFVIRPICQFVTSLGFDFECPGEEGFPPFPENPFKNIKLPLFLNTEEGCERCRCNIETIDVDDNYIADALNNFINQFVETNSSNLANFNSNSEYTPTTTDSVIGTDPSNRTVVTTDFNALYNGQLKPLLVGWNSPYSASDLFLSKLWKRLPFFTNAKTTNPLSIDGGKLYQIFSLDLTLSERFNLFNTKAKYFDNTSAFITWYPLLAQNTDSAQSISEYTDPDDDYYSAGNIYPANFDKITSDPTNRDIYLNESQYGQDINTSNAPAGATTKKYIYDAVQSLSPGNTGWNQVKVSWGIDFPENASTSNTVGPYKSHFDNLLVIITDSTPFTKGDLLTFQNPDDSSDINKGTTIGRYTTPTHVTVKYANPDFQLLNNASPLRSQQYKIANISTTSTGTTCFPVDVEYFQVVQIMPYNRYIELTNPTEGVPGNPSGLEYGKVRGDYRFSLPFRFMRSNHGELKRWGRIGTKYSTFDNDWKDPDFDNSQKVYTRFSQGGDLYSAQCYVDTTVQGMTEGMGAPSAGLTNNIFNLDSWESYNNKQNLNIVFLQRGVDPNSPKIKMRFDLRRYFGCRTNWNTQLCKKMGIANGGGAHIESTGTNISSPLGVPTWLVEGFYRMNVPIQPGGEDTTVGNWVTNNPLGLKLPNHNEILSNEPNPSGNWSHIFFESNFFSYDVNDNDFNGTWKTKMPLYYSALDRNAKTYAQQWMDVGINETFPALNSTDSLTIEEVPSGSVYAGVVKNSTSNHFGYRIIMEHARNKWDSNNSAGNNGLYNGDFKVPCSLTLSSDDLNHTLLNRQNELDLFGDDPCDNEYAFDAAYNGVDSAIPQGLCCQSGNQEYSLNPDYPVGIFNNGSQEFGGSNILPYVRRYHRLVPNYVSNNVAGYFGSEYVEGGSLFSALLNVESRPLRRDLDCSYGAEQCMYSVAYPDPDCATGDGLVLHQEREMYFAGFGGGGINQSNLVGYGDSATERGLYVSPVYAAFPDDVPPAAGFNSSNWYVNKNHEITMSNKKRIVFRTDRLPSSDFLQTDDNGNAYLLHQNSGFKIYKITDCIVENTGGGDVFLDSPSDTDVTELLPNTNYNEVANSLVNCSDAVDLNSYGVNADGTPFIHEQNPYSRKNADLGPDYKWFSRGTGCYNLVSKIFASLFATPVSTINEIPGLEPEKKYSDIRSIVEWTQRLKLTFAQCFDIFSHTFSNNWINGTLYAFSFQNATSFNVNNQPRRDYCKNTIYFHDPLNTYYYRSSPWDGNNFIGKAKYDLTVTNPDDAADRYGNPKNLLFPTTILDMGPKNRFIQEIVFSDDYDGYIADVIPSTTFKDITTLQNLFVLSRLVNTKFIQILFPAGNTDDNTGNESGSDDPSIAAFFGNQRWKSTVSNPNGEIFFSGLLPAQIDGDYSQLISINSEFGTLEYSPENYGQNSIYFAVEDDDGYPYYGVFFSGNNQQRDYITPRRTLYNPSATLPLTSADTTNIFVRTQVVPFYQWRTNQSKGDPTPTIFANQNNNFNTLRTTYFSSGYQSLDRLNAASQYYNPNGNNSINYKGYIYNINVTTGQFEVNSPSNYRTNYTFGAPFHFYFGLIQGASAMDRFITKYVDTNFING